MKKTTYERFDKAIFVPVLGRALLYVGVLSVGLFAQKPLAVYAQSSPPQPVQIQLINITPVPPGALESQLDSTKKVSPTPGPHDSARRPSNQPSNRPKAITMPVVSLDPSSNGAYVGKDPLNLYQQMTRMELKLYNQSYEEESVTSRLKRMEESLFHRTQYGSLRARLQHIQAKLTEKKIVSTDHSDEAPMLAYLEQKLFQTVFAGDELDKRISRLESHVFGKTFEGYPHEVRIKKLTYTMPIVAKGIRLSNEGTLVASTAKKPRHNRPTVVSPAVAPVDSGDYTANIYRPTDAHYLRWTKTPVNVFVIDAKRREKAMVEAAIDHWAKTFPVQITDKELQADILIDWQNTIAPAGPLTRPIIHLGQNKKIRTVILINMTPFGALQGTPPLPQSKLLGGAPISSRNPQVMRGMLHQMGHALGIWGHSQNPYDVMCPIHPLEQRDIPSRWLRRSPAPSKLAVRSAFVREPKPSQRDINTLTKIYTMPPQNIAGFRPNY